MNHKIYFAVILLLTSPAFLTAKEAATANKLSLWQRAKLRYEIQQALQNQDKKPLDKPEGDYLALHARLGKVNIFKRSTLPLYEGAYHAKIALQNVIWKAVNEGIPLVSGALSAGLFIPFYLTRGRSDTSAKTIRALFFSNILIFMLWPRSS